MKLKDKVAIVTGASSGIGRGIALQLAREGANVAIVDINLDGAKKVADEIKALGRKTIAIKTDVTKFEEVKLMTKRVRDELGDVDILVNNAGGQAPGTKPSPLWEKTERDWDAGVALNLKSVFNCCRAVIERMIERRTGKIVNIASVAGIIGGAPLTDYSAAKGGVIAFTKTLAKEVAAYGINVNSISPGPTETPLFIAQISGKIKEDYKRLTGLGRLCKPEDIAYMAAFLVSDEAIFITGHDHVVAGLRDIGGAWEVNR
jgi:NAD(P)-dependent dehydrogenase (short-subunit alcohol dehydrogenase family)